MTSAARIFGLVLAGGKSSRMGRDKGLLKYHGIDQRSHMVRLLAPFCDRTFISCRHDQSDQLLPQQQYIADEDIFQGPLNGILSAHNRYPAAAWLVVAVDLPHLKTSSLIKLIDGRDSKRAATAYATHASGLPEPMITIWEPSAMAAAKAYAEEGKMCARKFLLGQDIQLVYPDHDRELYNANHPEEFEKAKEQIQKA